MSEPFLGQIQCFGFGFAPKNWALCNGQLLAIQQNAALFSLIGITFGGNGTTTFALPNLQSRVPMHQGTSPSGDVYVIGEQSGEEQVFLLQSNMPQHTHSFIGSSANGASLSADPGQLLATAYLANGMPTPLYGTLQSPETLNPLSIGVVGGNTPHNNIQPYLTINWCIALRGVFPSRN